MNGTQSLRTPEIFHIKDNGASVFGANQEWYPTEWQRRAGCGPTVCAHLLCYLSRTRAGMEALWQQEANTKEGFLLLMQEIWKYVTPGMMGVNSMEIFTGGALRFAAKRGVVLSKKELAVPLSSHKRPSREVFTEFIASAISDDLPVAFLNLSNGTLDNLDNWHWVTMVSFDCETNKATMYDQGARSEIDILRWLSTTTLGGGLVTLSAGESV